MFSIGDLVAHPLHGAGTICEIEQKRIDGKNKDYYVMTIPAGGMRIMVPVDGCEAVGLRPIIDSVRAEEILAQIPMLEVIEDSSWNKRYRENMLRIRSGNLLEVAAVVKSLVLRESERGLSTGERKMLHSAKQILISEIVLCLDSSYSEVEERLNQAFA